MKKLTAWVLIAAVSACTSAAEQPFGIPSGGGSGLPQAPASGTAAGAGGAGASGAAGAGTGDAGSGTAAVAPADQPISFTVTLTGLTQNLLPVGLPSTFTILTNAAPVAGGSVQASWTALDGDTARTPRSGIAEVTFAADMSSFSVALTSSDPSVVQGTALTLTGSVTGSGVTGSFLDTLFSPRSGTFSGSLE